MTRLPIRTRLTVFYTAVLALVVTALSVTFYRVLALQLEADATAELAQLTSGLHGYLRVDHEQPAFVVDRTDADQVAFVEAASRYYQVFDAASGRLLAQSPAIEPLGLQFTPSEVRAFRERLRVVDVATDRGRLRLSNSVITGRDGGSYLLQVGILLDQLDAALARALRLLLWIVPVSLVVAVLAGRMLAARSLAPLAELAARTRAISVDDLTARLPVRGVHDELDEVAHAFNDALARLERAIGDMRQFSAAIAHELRTPLAALRGETELALLRASSPADYRRTLESQLEELDTLARLITQLLTLARAEAGEIPLTVAAVDLAALSTSVVEQLDAVAQARAITLACGRLEPVVVAGDPRWLERLLLNLIDNAIKFTGAGGRITVDVYPAGPSGALQVTDTGVGIPPDALPHIFERFYTVDPARHSAAEGVGLGLSLVQWIVDRHRGTIDVASDVGQGTSVTVRLPRAPSS